jgi:sugar lactone lactonase YvrE
LTIAGGNGQGDRINQLSQPCGICIDDDYQCIYIADYANDRIVQWKFDTNNVQVVAGGNGSGDQMNQLSSPTDVMVDKKTDSLIICDNRNKRVVRWSRHNGKNGETIISGVDCYGLAMDNNGDLYVSDRKGHEVRRWKIGELKGTVVAGGNKAGDYLHQLDTPTFVFIDRNHSLYVSDSTNHRVMKWMKGAKEGIIVAGGQDLRFHLTQLNYPKGMIVDHLGNVYVADTNNHRIMCWSKGSKEGQIIVGGNGSGQQSNQLNYPTGLSFDRLGNLYVADLSNNRVQKFEIDLN